MRLIDLARGRQQPAAAAFCDATGEHSAAKRSERRSKGSRAEKGGLGHRKNPCLHRLDQFAPAGLLEFAAHHTGSPQFRTSPAGKSIPRDQHRR